MLPSPLDVSGLASFSDEKVLRGAERRVVDQAWRVARLYQGQLWGISPSWDDPWADETEEDEDSVGKSDLEPTSESNDMLDANQGSPSSSIGLRTTEEQHGAGVSGASKRRTHKTNQDRGKTSDGVVQVTAPPGCCIARWGTGHGGGLALLTVSSKLLRFARGDAEGADLLGSWLARSLFEALPPPEGTRAKAADTALLVALDMPLVAAAQTRPSPKVDDLGNRLAFSFRFVCVSVVCVN